MRLPEIYEHSVTRTGIVTYGIELEHLGLKKHRVIKDRDLDILERRATLQLEQWEEQWVKKQARQAAADARAAAQREKEQAQREAQDQTDAAQQRLAEIENTLRYTLTRDDTVEWDSLKDFSTFRDDEPIAVLPRKPELHRQPDKPSARAEEFNPTFSFFDHFSSRRKEARRQEAHERYHVAVHEWRQECEGVTRANEQLEREYQGELARAEADHQNALDKWRDGAGELPRQTASAEQQG